jgi:hypothetical protein
VLLRPVKISAVISPSTSDKVNHLQDLDQPGLAVVAVKRETWVLTKKEENRLLGFERKVLRTICGMWPKNSVYRSRYNFKLSREFNSSNVIGDV